MNKWLHFCIPKEIAQARGFRMEDEKMEVGWRAFEGNCTQGES
jgi:hypothetical protein